MSLNKENKTNLSIDENKCKWINIKPHAHRRTYVCIYISIIHIYNDAASIPFPVQNGSSSVQNGNISFQNGNSSIQNGNSSFQNGNSSVQNGKIIISINITNIL